MEDPWGISCFQKLEDTEKKFEDNFVCEKHLPDSKEYIKRLENRLNKLKNKDFKDKDLLNALSKTKLSHLERLVDSNSNDTLIDPNLDQPISPSILQRFIAPDKQANTISELFELIKYDQLGQLFENLEKNNQE